MIITAVKAKYNNKIFIHPIFNNTIRDMLTDSPVDP